MRCRVTVVRVGGLRVTGHLLRMQQNYNYQIGRVGEVCCPATTTTKWAPGFPDRALQHP